jgi:hypothetical protein
MNWVTDESSAVAPTRSTASPEPGRTSAVASASATRVSVSSVRDQSTASAAAS